MADGAKPWDRYKGATVTDAPPPQTQQQPSTEAPMEGPPTAEQQREQQQTKAPWERYSDANVGARPTHVIQENTATTTERQLEASRVEYTAPSTETWTGWINRAARSATLGLSDTITAFAVQQQMQDEVPDLSYSEALRAVRQGFEEDKSLSAEIVGALAPGAVVGKGITRAWQAATQAGLTRGALNWAARQPKLARIAGATAAASSAGAVEEGIRTSVDETIGIAAAEDFNADRIIDSTITGALVGGIVGGSLQTAARGAGPVPGVVDVFNRFIREGLGVGDQQAVKASSRIANALRRGNETVEETAERLQSDATRFYQDNGYMPALSDLVAPEDVREIVDISRYFSGLDRRAGRYAQERLEEATNAFRRAVDSGQPLKSAEEIQAKSEDLFTAVTRQYGQTPVKVSDDVLTALREQRTWLGERGKTNPAARAMARVLDASENVQGFREKSTRLRNATSVSEAQAEVADLRQHIAEILSDQVEGGAVEASELAQLRNLANLLDARANAMAKSVALRNAEYDANAFNEILNSAESVLRDFEENGLRVSLSDANHLRASASKFAFQSQDPAQQEVARAVRDAVANVGVEEVPRYGNMVRLWRDAMTRVDAQETGRAAAAGEVNLRDLGVRLRKNRLPQRGGRAAGTQAGALQRGAREGAMLRLGEEAGRETSQVVSTARRISGSPNTRQGLEMAAPDDASRIIGASERLGDAADRSRAMASPSSPTATTEEIAELRDIALGGALGSLGGAGRAALIARILQSAKISRGAAEKVIDMLGDPDQFDKALRYMETRGVDVGAFTGAMAAAIEGIGSEG